MQFADLRSAIEVVLPFVTGYAHD